MGAGVFVAAASPVSASPSAPVSDSGVIPDLQPKNPGCPDGTTEYKVDQDPGNGVWSDGDFTVTTNTDGVYLAWTSNIGVDAVIMKGGDDGNVYVYDPPAESFGDSGLASPINPNTGRPYDISHVSFCYDLELDVTKTAVTSFDRDWDWTIQKDVDTAVLDLFDGDSGVVNWNVDVTKSGPTDSNFAVAGVITIANPWSTAANVTSVTDVITGGINATVDCGPAGPTGEAPFSVPAGGSVTCTYSSALPDTTARTNTATVTTTGAIGGDSGTAAVAFGAPTNETDASIDVTDTNGMSWLDIGATTSLPSYPQTFECSTTDGDGTDAGNHVNTATITQTGQSDSADTTVNCYGLDVSKTARTAERQVFDWGVEKTSSVLPGTVLTLALDQVYPVTFTVNATVSSHFDQWAVAGAITVHNPAPIDVDLISVSDAISGVDGNVAVDCGVEVSAANPYTLTAGGPDLVCAYASSLPDGTERLNTATVTTEFGVDYTGTAPVTFVGADVTELDRCVQISDSQFPTLASLFDTNNDGQICVGEEAVRSYTIDLIAAECGPAQYSNVVDLNGVKSTVLIDTNVPCDTGCSLTIGYWKTHSDLRTGCSLRRRVVRG